MPEEEQAAYYEQLRRTFERADEMLDSLAERAEQRRLDGSDIEERYAERQRQERQQAATPQPAPASRAPRAPARDWDAEARWVAGIAGQKINTLIDNGLTPFAKEVGEEVGKLERRIRELQDRLIASESATVQLITDLEREIKELRERAILQPSKPRLISGGGSDGAA